MNIAVYGLGRRLGHVDACEKQEEYIFLKMALFRIPFGVKNHAAALFRSMQIHLAPKP